MRNMSCTIGKSPLRTKIVISLMLLLLSGVLLLTPFGRTTAQTSTIILSQLRPSFYPVPIDSSSIAFWHLDEGRGTTTADVSTNRNVGILRNGPTWTSYCEHNQPPFGNCLIFSGNGTYVEA